MADFTEYFSMQGRVYLGLRNADGSRQPAKWVYDASTLSWAMSAETEDKFENYSGARGLAATLKTTREMTVNLTLGQLNTDLAAIAMDGVRVEIAAGAVVNETIGNVQPGNVVALEYALVSDLALVDGAAAALVEGTDFEVNLLTGVITFLSTKTGVKASAYDYAAHSIVTALNGGSPDYYLMFDGENTVDGAVMKCLGQVHRVSFMPASEFGFIQDSFGEFELEGKAKIDPVRAADPKWGPFARVKLISG